MKEEEEVRSVRYKEVELRGVNSSRIRILFFFFLEYYLDDVGGKYFISNIQSKLYIYILFQLIPEIYFPPRFFRILSHFFVDSLK